jgi:hypothetical protein
MNTTPVLLLVVLVLAGSSFIAAHGKGDPSLPGNGAVDVPPSSGSSSLDLSFSSSGGWPGMEADINDKDIPPSAQRWSVLDLNIAKVAEGADPNSLPLLRAILMNEDDKDHARVKARVEEAQRKWQSSSGGSTSAKQEKEARKAKKAEAAKAAKTTAHRFSKEEINQFRERVGLPALTPPGQGGPSLKNVGRVKPQGPPKASSASGVGPTSGLKPSPMDQLTQAGGVNTQRRMGDGRTVEEIYSPTTGRRDAVVVRQHPGEKATVDNTMLFALNPPKKGV